MKYIKPGKSAFNSDIHKTSAILRKPNKSNLQKTGQKPSYTVTEVEAEELYTIGRKIDSDKQRKGKVTTFLMILFLKDQKSVRKQIGMAVPVKGAKIIFDSILKTFAGIVYPAIDEKF